jgi:ubiquinone/menaquinone biosynthesis C-methylase UbiE
MASQSDSEIPSNTVQDRINRYLSPERAQKLDPLVVLSFCPVNVNDTVGDIGCGPGYFTLPLAKFLVNGKVYALDLDEQMVAACRERIAQARLGNVEVLDCGEFDFPLDKNSLDGVFLAFVVHHSADRPRFLQAVRELISPKGWCSVLEWYPKETEGGPPLASRIAPEELEQLGREAGFRPRGWRDLNGDHYMMTLRNS